MVEHIKEMIKKEILVISICIVLVAIIINSSLIFYYRSVIVQNSKLKEQIFQANHGIEFMNKYVNLADLGLRGYMIEQDDKFLNPFKEAMANYQSNLESLKGVLVAQGYDISQMLPAEKAINDYMILVEQMVQMCAIGELDESINILKDDPGYDAWLIYSVFERKVLDFENKLLEETNQGYDSMIIRMAIAQLILVIIGVPVLIVSIRTIKRWKKVKAKLFSYLSKSNRDYIFDPGEEEKEENDEATLEKLIENLRKTAAFINNMTLGKYEITWDGLSKSNESLNKKNIAGELMMMRNQMQKAKKEDDIRIWINEGLSNFGDLIRKNQDDIDKLSDELTSNIVQYLQAQQGGLFFIEEDENKTQYLKLMGCYAYQRKKFLEKRIEIGQGMVGQCFLEGETTYVKNIPEEYVYITSGLGDTNPKTVLIVPLRINEEVVGVIEVAGLRPFEEYQIEFLERLAETIASAISSVKTNESTRILLEQSQQQAEEMRAQEEEMRQNMEELQATQEQIHRKNEEVENLLKQASENEEGMKMSLGALEELQEEAARKNKIILEEKTKLELEDAILSTIMDITIDRITVKDKSGNYLKLSKSKLQGLLDKGFEDVIGKSDREIFGEEHFAKSSEVEEKIMKNQKAVFDIIEEIKLSEDAKFWGSTSRAPLKDKNGDILGTVVITRNITKEKECEEKLKKASPEN